MEGRLGVRKSVSTLYTCGIDIYHHNTTSPTTDARDVMYPKKAAFRGYPGKGSPIIES